MSLVTSLLTAIVRADGDALVLHAGERPYVVAPAGQSELASRALTLDAMKGMIKELLSADAQQTLVDVGAVQHKLASPTFAKAETFTVIAARGGDDIWIEIRRRRAPAVVKPTVAPPVPIAPVAVVAPVVSEPVFASPPAAIATPQVYERHEPNEPYELHEPVEPVEPHPSGEPDEPVVVLSPEPEPEPEIELTPQIHVIADAETELEPEPVTEPEPVFELAVEPEPEIQVELEPEPEPEPELEPEPEPVPLLRAVAKTEPDVEFQLEAESQSEPEPESEEWNIELTAENLDLDAASLDLNLRLPHLEPEPEPEPVAEPEPEPELDLEPEPELEPEPLIAAAPVIEQVHEIEQETYEVGSEAEVHEISLDADYTSLVAPELPTGTVESPVAEAAPAPVEHAQVTPPSVIVPPSAPELEPSPADFVAIAAPHLPVDEARAPIVEAAPPPAIEAPPVDEALPVVEPKRTVGPVEVPPAAVAPPPQALEHEPEIEPEPEIERELEPGPRPAVVFSLARTYVRAEQSARFSPPLQSSGIDRLLRIAAARGAETLYLTSQASPSIRVDGEIGPIDGEAVLSEPEVESLILDIMPERNREALRSQAGTEWICDVPDVGRIRCVTFRDHRGAGGIFRMIPARAISAEQLGLSREIQGLCAEAEGLVLVAGPRSSGKSTLIAAFVDLINRTRSDHVITLENQIKFVHENRGSLVSQREVRGDRNELLSVARAALRENPDVLVIEDFGSPEIVTLALDAAQSGHLVIGAITAHSATDAVDRMIDQAPPDRRTKVQLGLAENLRGIVAQVLLRKIGGGRVAAREVLLTTRAVANVIAEGKTSQLPMAIDSGRKHGMAALNDALAAFVKSGIVDSREAYRRAGDHPGFLALLKRQGIDTSFVERLA